LTTTLPFKFENIVGSPVNITQFVTQVDSCKFQGSGKIRSLSLMLNADGGAFITNKDFLGTDFTPIINQFDKHKITWHVDGQTDRSMIVEADQELGQQVLNGTTLPIEFKGREAALQRRKLTAFYQFKSPNFVITDLVARYNTIPGKGTAEPTILIDSGGTDFIETVPTNVVNIYDFTKETSYYDAFMQIIRRLNQPVAQQGAGDFYSLVFTDGEDLPAPISDAIVLRCFVQGVGVAATLQSTPNDPFNSITYQIHSESGNQILVRGQQGTGYQPALFHEFISFVEQINNYPAHVVAETYVTGIIVRATDNSLYEANKTTTATPPDGGTDWDIKTPATIIPTSSYSFWTNNTNIVNIVKNGMSNATTAFGQTFGSPAFYDGNMVIRETHNFVTDSFIFWRDWAFLRSINPGTIPSAWLNFSGISGLYNGFRVLVDSTLGALVAPFDGTDKFGRTFADSLAFYNGDEWIVIREFTTANINQVGNQVVVIDEGITYEWNVPFTETNAFANAHTHSGNLRGFRNTDLTAANAEWRDVSQTAGGNDVFHHPTAIVRAPGLFPDNINGDDYTSFTANSAIKITYTFNLTQGICDFLDPFVDFFDDPLGKLIDLFADTDDIFETEYGTLTTAEENALKDASYYDFGWWYTLPFPYPLTTLNATAPNVGDLYGAAPGLAQKRDFAALDLQNANYSHSGNPGFNHTEVEDMGGPFTAIRFYFLFDIFLGGTPKPFAGNIDFIVTLYDDLSTVWRANFTYRFLGDSEEITIQFDEFTVDRPSRTPWGLRTAFQNIITPELEVRSIFEPKRVRFMSIALGDAYDDNLRYLPVNIENLLALGYGLGTVTFEGTIDALTLLKQPFTSSGVITDRTINPETVQMPNTRNLLQLRSVATALKDLHELQYEEYNVVTDLDNSLTVEQSVNLTDAVFVKNSPRKLVVMVDECSYHESGPKAGAKSTRILTRRLNP